MGSKSKSGNQAGIREINRLIEIARFGYHWALELGPGAAVKTYGNGEQAVSFIAAGVLTEFEEISNRLHSQDSEIRDWYSIDVFCEELAKLLRRLKSQDRQTESKDWQEFIADLKERPTLSLVIMAPIFGVVMQQDRLELGRFTIYKPEAIRDVIGNSTLNNKGVSVEGEISESTFYRLAITTEAKDRIRCYQLADKAFSDFEGLANYVTSGFHNTYDIRVIRHFEPKDSQIFVFDGDRTDVHFFQSRQFPHAWIDNLRYRDEYNGSKFLWDWISSPNTSLKKTVLDSIIWCGKASQEQDKSKAILLYVIAIECLFQFDEGKFVGPSIVSQISDMVAFLLGTSFDSRKEYAKMVRDTYQKRSAITHGGNTVVSDTDMHIALVICHQAIRTIVTKDPYRGFQSKSELCRFLGDLKYGERSEPTDAIEK